MTKPTGTSAERTLKVLILLKGHSLNGLSNGEIAKAMKTSPANITRALDSLVNCGLARKLETGRYAHSITMLQIAQAHANEMEKAAAKISEINSRVYAGALN